ncbi:MAG: GNAT family N-acetyltransferase [Flavobacteriaceae bacterium]|nr:GNAT family N-acetyltransferase [Flavobacteriaceae bacterium]
MSPIIIKKATISDLEIIQEISKQTFIETFADVNTSEDMENYVLENFNTEQVTSEINNRESAFYLATLNNETIGYLKLNFEKAQTETYNEQTLEIHRIYVLKAFLGKKIGQLLLDETVKIAQQTNVDYIWLGVWEQNHRALQFYAKNGFVEFDKHIFTLGNDIQTDLLLKLQMNK